MQAPRAASGGHERHHKIAPVSLEGQTRLLIINDPPNFGLAVSGAVSTPARNSRGKNLGKGARRPVTRGAPAGAQAAKCCHLLTSHFTHGQEMSFGIKMFVRNSFQLVPRSPEKGGKCQHAHRTAHLGKSGFELTISPTMYDYDVL